MSYLKKLLRKQKLKYVSRTALLKIALALVILLAIALRLYKLDVVPYGTSADESYYIYNAYSISQTAKDIEGKLLPLSFNTNSSMSPVNTYISAVVVGVLGFNLFAARLPAALIGVGSVILLYLITTSIFKNKWMGILSALLLAISPWALQLNRGNWDVDFAMFFYLLGIYLFITNTKSKKFLWSLIPFALAFYSYHATKVFFVFLIPVLLFIFRRDLMQKKKALIVFLTGAVLIVLSFFVIMKTQNITRQEDVFFTSNAKSIAKEVNFERDKNIAPWNLRAIFNNKLLTYLKVARENYLGAFSTNYLFMYGEVGSGAVINNIFNRGELYIIELPLLLIGFAQLIIRKDKLPRNLIFSLLLISALPSTVTYDKNYVIRDFMMLPMFILIISAGLHALILKIKSFRKLIAATILAGLFFLYTFLFLGYLYQYYYRWPVYGAEAVKASSRDLANYVGQNRNNYKEVYIGNANRDLVIQYAIFNKINPQLIQQVWNQSPIKLDNVTFLSDCLNNGKGKIKDFLPENSLYVYDDNLCHYSSTPSARIIDRGEPLHIMWDIYENI